MAEDQAYFDHLRQVMKIYHQWYDYPNDSVRGKLMKVYNVFRMILYLIIVLIATSQTYYYGKSYLVHDSAVFLPIGVMAIVVNSCVAWNYSAIMNSASQFELYLNSFLIDWEKELITNRMENAKVAMTGIINLIKFYIIITVLTHCTSVPIHYFFDIFPKPVLLPLLLEKFMDGNFQLRPMLFVHVILSLLYIQISASILMCVAFTVHFSGSATGALEVLIKRLEDLSEKTAEGCQKLAEDSDLRDTVQKHAELLNLISGMMEWNGFIVSFTLTSLSILFCINAITVKQSINNKEYSSTVIWGTFLIATIAISSIMCSRGQEIEKKSEEFLRAIYNLPWYRESTKSRRSIAIMLAQGNRLINLEYKGLMSVNMVTLSEMLQKSYSYFTILGSVE